MQDYIAKVRGASDTSSRPQANQDNNESMDTNDGGRGEELQESSDEGVYMEWIYIDAVRKKFLNTASDSERPVLKKPKIANICYWAKKDK